MLRVSLYEAAGPSLLELAAPTDSNGSSLRSEARYTKKPDDTTLPGTPPKIDLDDVAAEPITTPVNPSTDPIATIPPENVPREPPSPEEVQATPPESVEATPSESVQATSSDSVLATPPPSTSTPPTPLPPTGTGTSSVAPPPNGAPPPPPPAPKRKPRRFRRFLTAMLLLSALGYGGSVYMALVNDNFHDFFTEYVPFGEDAVAYFEEREFRKRFPETTTPRRHEVRDDNKVKIPSNSGLSSRVTGESDPNKADLLSKGRHVSALEDNKIAEEQAKQNPEQAKPKDTREAGAERQKDPGPSEPEPKPAAEPPKPAAEPPKPAAEPPKPAPEPPKPVPAAQIDNLKVEGADEPVVQEVVKILNDIITVVNADNAGSKYASTIDKAKGELGKVLSDITTMKATINKEAEDKIRASHTEFDAAAKELMRRLEAEMKEQEARWKDEYEAERQKLSETYDNKLRSELDTTKKVYEQRLKNELLEQAIALQRQCTESVRDRVETERSGRLSKLDELSSSVAELERLTAEWNSVVDANLKTQHLVVAVEAVRNALEAADRPKPFVDELVALKETAGDDPVVNAAIASINPSAYQRGISTTSQLIDRFRLVAHEVRKAALLPENAGVASHAASLLLSKFMFRKDKGAIGLPVGNDVESVLARAELLLEEGNIDQAAREVNQLQGWAKVLCRDWLAEARRVLEVKQALDVITTEARLQSLLVD
ncbi:MICOS complex subunit mic60 [Coniosporium tulheliwenetii]|uniref:MICOS complex subunit mic60 n=1 Tax=Coniosporium tulheliwenetii TaxID=3383036 RepID=A0ACC2Z9G8_9PEZI|nr:MICOS complex subunit mic60 [Cladosporium sp. JES 115]